MAHVLSSAELAYRRSLHLVVRADETLLAGQPLYRGTTDELFELFDDYLAEGDTHLIVTPNVDQVLTLLDDESARSAFAEARLRLVDGAPLVALAKILGDHDLRRLTGADLLVSVSAASASRGWAVAIAGGDPVTSKQAAAKLRVANPGSNVISVPFPFIDRATDPEGLTVVEALARVKPDIVFLCLGAPKQEEWFLAWRHLLPDAIYVGAGACVDFAAEKRKRAPRIAQSLGAEWLWRVAQEPRRLARRYFLKGPRFVMIAARSLWPRRLPSAPENEIGTRP